MQKLIFAGALVCAMAWAWPSLAVVDEEKEVPVTGTAVPTGTVTITDQSTGKMISTSKVEKGKTRISIHEPTLTRKSKVTITFKNEKGETTEERKDVVLGLLLDGGFAFNGGSGQTAETHQAPSTPSRHPTVRQPTSGHIPVPPVVVAPPRLWEVFVGGDFGFANSSNNYDSFPSLGGVGAAGGGHAGIRYYFLPNYFVGFEGGLIGSNLRSDQNDIGTFVNYRWQAWEMGQVGVIWIPQPWTTPIDLYVGGGFAQGGVNFGINNEILRESMTRTVNGFIVRIGADVYVTSNVSFGGSYSFSQFTDTVEGDALKAQISMILINGTYHFP